MTEGANDSTAFAYLSDLKKKFIQDYDYDRIASFHAYQLTEFEGTLKNLMVKLNLIK